MTTPSLALELSRLYERLRFHQARLKDYEKMQLDNASRMEYHTKMMEMVNAEIIEKTGGR